MSKSNKLIKKEFISKEINFLPVKTKGSVPVNVSLVYPNTYSLGMSNLGFHSIYNQINSRDDALCHRAFYSIGKSGLFPNTIEGDKPLSEYDIVGFSVSFELDYMNIFKILEAIKVPVFAKDRNFPLIMAGGPTCTFNPEPLAPFIDFFVIGEGEEVIHEIIQIYKKLKNSSKNRILEALAQIKGVYVPAFYDINYDENGSVFEIKTQACAPKQVEKRWIKNLNKYKTESVILTPNTEFKDMFLMEISRGCGRNCRFCMAGYCYRIPRFRSIETILERAKIGARFKKKIGLVGAAISDYPLIDKLVENLIEKDIKFSVSSLRADSLTEPLIKGLSFSGHRTLTIAPEASSNRLRKVINKGITEEHVINSIELAHKYRIENIKLYYIIGLPEETHDDINEMIDFVTYLKDYMKGLGNKLGSLTISVNPFIPKPFTPFQWFGMESVDLLNEKLKFLQSNLKPKGIRVIFESPRLSQIQSALSRGDRQMGLLLYEIYKKGGNTRAFKTSEISGRNMEFYAHRNLNHSDVLPWDHIDIGIKKQFFISEYKKALKGKSTERCTEQKCTNCKTCYLK